MPPSPGLAARQAIEIQHLRTLELPARQHPNTLAVEVDGEVSSSVFENLRCSGSQLTGPVRFSSNPYFSACFLVGTVFQFFFPAETLFQLVFSAKRTAMAQKPKEEFICMLARM